MPPAPENRRHSPALVQHVNQPGLAGGVLDLEPRRVAVLLIDFQNDFCQPPAASADPAQTRANAAAAQRAETFAAAAAGLGARVIYTQQLLDLARLTERQRRWERESRLCVPGTQGADLFIRPVRGSRVVTKFRFDIWHSEEFLQALADWDIDGLVIGGVELVCCVLYAVLGAEERGFHYVVVQDLLSGIGRTEPANAAVRQYLQAVHPSVGSADDFLLQWQRRWPGRPDG